MREREETKEREYAVSYWVTFLVEAKDEEEATAKAERELVETIKRGNIRDHISDGPWGPQEVDAQ
jgi:hypothetical protein